MNLCFCLYLFVWLCSRVQLSPCVPPALSLSSPHPLDQISHLKLYYTQLSVYSQLTDSASPQPSLWLVIPNIKFSCKYKSKSREHPDSVKRQGGGGGELTACIGFAYLSIASRFLRWTVNKEIKNIHTRVFFCLFVIMGQTEICKCIYIYILIRITQVYFELVVWIASHRI